MLIVGLVQLVPNAADADHRYIFIGAGGILLVVGFIMTAVRCFCMHCARNARIVMEDPPPPLEGVNSIDVLVQRRDTQVGGVAAGILVFEERLKKLQSETIKSSLKINIL